MQDGENLVKERGRWQQGNVHAFEAKLQPAKPRREGEDVGAEGGEGGMGGVGGMPASLSRSET